MWTNLSAKNPKIVLPVHIPAMYTADIVPASQALSHTRAHCQMEMKNINSYDKSAKFLGRLFLNLYVFI